MTEMRELKELPIRWSVVVLATLALALMASIAMIYYQHRSLNQLNARPTAQAPAKRDFDAVLGKFFASLPNADASTKLAHQDLLRSLKQADGATLPSQQTIDRLIAHHAIPYDYLYFFKECMPAYARGSTAPLPGLKDANILLSLPRGTPYKASLFINDLNDSSAALKSKIETKVEGNRLAVSGAYTSPFNMPAGLTIQAGRVVNPVIQKFDGLLVISKEGEVSIADIGRLEMDFRTLNIRANLKDYKDFLAAAERGELSVIQSNLLVDAGQITVEPSAPKSRLRRRVIFETAAGEIQVYDSLAQSISLLDAAKLLHDKYKAIYAFNLETGSYGFCVAFKGSQVNDRSDLRPGVILSNLILFDY